MIKSIIMFFSFFIIDLVLFIIFENIHAISLFLPAIFLEVAIYGSFIIYEISKLLENKQKDKKQGEKKDD